eukprot:Blabericola_migrator_1__7591@NODE_387_length_9104_cov_64_864336_g310_i0_p4_GENE_NODE_387_length_9104_cov_64_864336_g310_i0NODE_387_length_9104_cov_64_864336_g310_i0_p4_ORF_typecomplete_len335_score51_56DA1like/PF12315_8/4_2e08Peptidase_M78/PF06114_13/0_00051DUF2321/PF10083_9/3_8e02DUF2321/PF10083_9/0_21DUF4428/PF14471_6/1_5e02DUF4428/PF14471_6/3_2e02DUF4428/PF14471_6/0_84SprTlike/PF10263_9/0_43_NODE_387_length_9104_cov_64_864336_g310_i032464250
MPVSETVAVPPAKPQTWCDVCGLQLPKLLDEDNKPFYDCYVHPFWRQNQILCQSCARSDIECCFVCEFKIPLEQMSRTKRTSEGYICEYCTVSAPVEKFKEAYIIKEELVKRMAKLFSLSDDFRRRLSRLPVRLKLRTRETLEGLSNHMDCSSWNESRSIFGYCAFERYDQERLMPKEIIILKGLPRLLFTMVLAHELVHVVLSVKKSLIFDFPPAQKTILARASVGHYRDYCQSSHEYRELEEGACHLFAGEVLLGSQTYSHHEIRLKDLWIYKILPSAENEMALANPVLPLYYSVQRHIMLTSDAPTKASLLTAIWTRVVEDLSVLKCVWDF